MICGNPKAAGSSPAGDAYLFFLFGFFWGGHLRILIESLGCFWGVWLARGRVGVRERVCGEWWFPPFLAFGKREGGRRDDAAGAQRKRMRDSGTRICLSVCVAPRVLDECVAGKAVRKGQVTHAVLCGLCFD